VKEASRSFLKKRTKKLLRRRVGDSRAKVFASFFKKKRFLVLLLACGAIAACGKLGPNQPPGPPDQVHWPKIYPTQ